MDIYSIFPLDKNFKVIGKKITNTALEPLFMLMGINTKVIGSMIRRKVKENFSILMELFMKENFVLIRSKVMVLSYIRMEIGFKAHLNKVLNAEKEGFHILMAMISKVNL